MSTPAAQGAGAGLPGIDWENVPLHLPSTFTALEALTGSPEVRVALLGDYGLTWPWESLHVEALAWFDHWLKDRDTGILDGPAIRYVLPAAVGWHTTSSWPPPERTHRMLALRADGPAALAPPSSRAAPPRPYPSARSSATACRWSPTPGGSRRATASSW